MDANPSLFLRIGSAYVRRESIVAMQKRVRYDKNDDLEYSLKLWLRECGEVLEVYVDEEAEIDAILVIMQRGDHV